MPSAVHVADQLSQLSLSELTRLLTARPNGMNRQHDLHDVADTLLSTDSISAALRGLSRESLDNIRGARVDGFGASLLLTDRVGRPYPEVSALLPVVLDRPIPAEPTLVPTDASTLLHTTVALRDVIAWAMFEPIPMSATGGLLKADEKLLAQELVLPDNEVATIVWLVQVTGLARNVDRRLRATSLGATLIDNLPGLWRAATDSLFGQFPASVIGGLMKFERLDADFCEWTWPLHSASDGTRLDLIQRSASLLGLVSGATTELGRAALADDDRAIDAILAANLPPLAESVYVLDDLSVIAPGPISSSAAAVLDSMTVIEARGLAAKRRLDATRILRTLSAGSTVESLIQSLASHSLTPLTAAVTSTITDIATNTRFVSLNGTGTDTAAKASHPELGAMLLTDPRLQRLAPVKVDEFTVLYGASRDRVETALVEGRYTVVAPERHVPLADDEPTDAITELAERLHGAGLGSSHLERALVVAGKAKSRVTIVVKTPDGLRTMTIEPRHVANGRVRGLDTGSDVERTVPISAIIELKAVGE